MIQETPIIPLLIGGKGPITAAIDTGSPLTVVHFRGDGQVSNTEIRLQHGLQPSVSRFIFPDAQSLDLDLGPIGLDTPFTVGGVVGASLLRHFTVELSYGPTPQLTLSDEIPDSKAELAAECDPDKLLDPQTSATQRCQGTFHTPAVGGGLVAVGDTTMDLPATRVVVSLCLMPAAFDPTKVRGHGAESPSGVPVTAVVSTGLGTSVLSRSALRRLQATAPTLTPSPGSTLHLPYGAEQASTLTLDRVAVVSDETDELNPCGELALRRRMLVASQVPLSEADRELIGDKSVDGASTAMPGAPVRFAVVDDEAPLIQSLRKELSPAVADVDVVLGGSFLRNFDFVADYPASRVILRCRAGETCEILPWCGEASDATPRCPGLDG